MGWSDTRIKKVMAVLVGGLWLYLLVDWLRGGRSHGPVDLAITALIVAALSWEAFFKPPTGRLR